VFYINGKDFGLSDVCHICHITRSTNVNQLYEKIAKGGPLGARNRSFITRNSNVIKGDNHDNGSKFGFFSLS